LFGDAEIRAYKIDGLLLVVRPETSLSSAVGTMV